MEDRVANCLEQYKSPRSFASTVCGMGVSPMCDGVIAVAVRPKPNHLA